MTGTVFPLGGNAAARVEREENAACLALTPGQLHEVHADGADRAAALAFALGWGGADAAGTILLVTATGRRRRSGQLLPYGEGLAMLGVDPARLTIVDTDNEMDLLRAGLEGARCPGVGMVLLDTVGGFTGYDLTASRRLALAAEKSGVCVALLRLDASPRASAARSRWRVASAPAVPWEANTPGWPTIDVEIERWRGGKAGGRWRLIWDVNNGRFRAAAVDEYQPAPLSGAVVPLSPLRDDPAGSVHRSGTGRSRAA